MNSEVEIVNIALARLGESPVQSLDEGSVSANMARVFYTPAKRAVLRAFPWSFSLKTARPARLSGDTMGFHFAFSLPADCLRVIRCRKEGSPDFSESGTVRFSVRSGVLLADESDFYIEYVADVDDVTLFDDKFVEAFSYKLASDLAMPVKGSSELMANYMNVFTDLVK